MKGKNWRSKVNEFVFREAEMAFDKIRIEYVYNYVIYVLWFMYNKLRSSNRNIYFDPTYWYKLSEILLAVRS